MYIYSYVYIWLWEFLTIWLQLAGNNISDVPVVVVATNRTTRLHRWSHDHVLYTFDMLYFLIRSLYHLLLADGGMYTYIVTFCMYICVCICDIAFFNVTSRVYKDRAKWLLGFEFKSAYTQYDVTEMSRICGD